MSISTDGFNVANLSLTAIIAIGMEQIMSIEQMWMMGTVVDIQRVLLYGYGHTERTTKGVDRYVQFRSIDLQQVQLPILHV